MVMREEGAAECGLTAFTPLTPVAERPSDGRRSGHSDNRFKPLMLLCVNEAGRVRIGVDFIGCIADS